MARQNVGNPIFYIDYLSYWKAKGNIKNVLIEGLQTHEIIGLNPTNYINRDISYPFSVEIKLENNVYMPRSADDKFFIGMLGHNFFNINVKSPYLKWIDNDGASAFELSDVTLEEICNMPTDGTSTFEYNGWSLGQWQGGDSDSFFDIQFNFDSDNVSQSNQTVLGNLVFGYAFQMPHSPDLKLTMTREYDGIQTQKTKGGSTLTQINYHNAADWAGYPAWELYKGNTINYINNDFVETRDSARGRRIWDLKFSYIDHKNMLPINELVNTSNPTDSYTDSLAGYDADDFNSSGHFSSDIRRDSSFMGVVMEKTIGGALPFIFQPDGNNNSPDQFAICQIDQGSFQFKQVAHNVYDLSLKIREVW